MTDSPFWTQTWFKVLLGMFLGVSLGLILSPTTTGFLPGDMSYSIGSWIALPGVIFIGLLKMVVIPLVICSVILGVTSSGSTEFLKTIGIRLIPYFVLTTAIAITIGMTWVHTTQPGQYIDTALAEQSLETTGSTFETFDDLTIPERIANLIPTNFTQASLEKNMLQIVIASLVLGIVMLNLPSKTVKPFQDLCIFGQAATMKVIDWAISLAPYAVFGLMCNITIKIGFDIITGVGAYVLTVLLGLLSMAIIYLLIVRYMSNHKPLSFLRAIREPQIFAFSTSSSAATMPFSLRAAEQNLKTDSKVSGFVIPLGATINMDGTALYQAIAALFLCQVFGVELTFVETILLLITTIGASIGTPATPGVGIIVLATILTGIGVPAEGIGLILGVDRILDMCRTTINVTGDLTATTVMQKWVKTNKA